MGRLRTSETERITERLRHSVIEIIISWSMFGQKNPVEFLTHMVVLGFSKIFHWLLQDRVNFLQTEPEISRLQHVRTLATLALLAVRPFSQPSFPPFLHSPVPGKHPETM